MNSPFLKLVVDIIRIRHYSIKTEKSYLYWIKYYIHFHKKQHPKNLSEDDVKAFLTFLATEKNVAANNTQAQALNAIVFMYKHAINKELKDFSDFTRAKKPKKLPVVLNNKTEIRKILSHLQGQYHLLASLM